MSKDYLSVHHPRCVSQKTFPEIISSEFKKSLPKEVDVDLNSPSGYDYFFSENSIPIDYKKRDLSNIDFYGVSFKGENLDELFHDIDVKTINLDGVLLGVKEIQYFLNKGVTNFTGVVVKNEILTPVVFPELDFGEYWGFSGARIDNCSFDNLMLKKMDFSNADIYKVTFNNSSLINISFRCAKIYNSELINTKVYDLILDFVSLKNTKFDLQSIKNPPYITSNIISTIAINTDKVFKDIVLTK